MAIAPTFQRYLDQHVTYDVIAGGPCPRRRAVANQANRPVLRDATGYMLAVLPASHHIRMRDLHSQFGEDVDLASEREIDELFSDCVHGAVPPIGECYGLDMIVDNSIDGRGDVYLEAGDHETLVRLSHLQFAKLTADARHGRFSVHV